MKKTRTSPGFVSPLEYLAQLLATVDLTERQRKFLTIKTTWPWPCDAKAARLAGYSESVSLKASRVIVRESRTVSGILRKWNQWSDRLWKRSPDEWGRVFDARN